MAHLAGWAVSHRVAVISTIPANPLSSSVTLIVRPDRDLSHRISPDARAGTPHLALTQVIFAFVAVTLCFTALWHHQPS
jgi:hypothetical protein